MQPGLHGRLLFVSRGQSRSSTSVGRRDRVASRAVGGRAGASPARRPTPMRGDGGGGEERLGDRLRGQAPPTRSRTACLEAGIGDRRQIDVLAQRVEPRQPPRRQRRQTDAEAEQPHDHDERSGRAASIVRRAVDDGRVRRCDGQAEAGAEHRELEGDEDVREVAVPRQPHREERAGREQQPGDHGRPVPRALGEPTAHVRRDRHRCGQRRRAPSRRRPPSVRGRPRPRSRTAARRPSR